MKNESILEDREKLNKLEKAFHRAGNLFLATGLVSMLPWVALVNSVDGPNEGYYCALSLISIPVIFTAWLNAMSKKTEEYTQLRDKYDRPLF